MPIPPHVRLEPPWQAVPGDQVPVLGDQLRRELPTGHILTGVKIKAIAMATNRDDVLFQLIDYEKPLAVVHLTWSQTAQTDPGSPKTYFYSNWDDWVRERLIPDSAGLRE